MSNIQIFKNTEALSHALAATLWGLSANKNTIHIALSGGSTPKTFFEILAKEYGDKIKWENIHFWWGDERCVEPQDQESNYRMTRESLFDAISIPADNIHRILGEMEPDDEAKRYEQEISMMLNNENGLPVFDLIYLGMGNDGHTASIFPDRLELLDSTHVCEVAIHPESGQKRVTLTGKVINNAKSVCFLVTGESKAEKIEAIFKEKAGYLNNPAAHIRLGHGQLYWMLDEKAAKLIL
jgi:6-phosphogluconolactonase